MAVRIAILIFCVLHIPTAQAQNAVLPSQRGACPTGTIAAGAGYCRSTSAAQFIPSLTNACPGGTIAAGAGYCRVTGLGYYVPAQNGACPTAFRAAGAGYCRQ